MRPSLGAFHVYGDCHLRAAFRRSLSVSVDTIRFAAYELYYSDILPPCLTEASFSKLLRKVTSGVEFSFDEVMYRQTDGVAMGSPLGPVLANIFVGFHEQKLALEDNTDVLLY